MQLFRVNRLPLFNVADVQSGNNPPPVDPAVVANANPDNPPPAPQDPPAPVAEPAPAPAASAEPPAPAPQDPPQPDSQTHQHGNKGKKPWFLDRISEETHARQQAEQRAQEAEAMLERLRRGAPADPANPNPPPAAANDADVEARARQLMTQQLAAEKIGSVSAAGMSAYADWQDRARNLETVGAASPQFILDVHAIDPVNAHKIFFELSNNLEKAAHLARMDQRNRTIELVRMSMAATAPAPQPAKPAAPARTISNAPPPPPALEPSAAQVVDWRSDKASDADFSRGWEQQQAERAKRGRR